MSMRIVAILLLASAILAGCAGQRAPVYDRAAADKAQAGDEKDWRPEYYEVQKGDTMFSIAFNYGYDYRELSELNGIKDPGVISVGQRIRLFPGKAISDGAAGAAPPPPPDPKDNLLKEQPRLVKYAYSEAAVAKAEQIQQEVFPPVTSLSSPSPVSAPAPVTAPRPVAQASSTPAVMPSGNDAMPDWVMPAQGKLVGRFSESSNRKGIDIAGKLGQPVVASAPGKVVYSGSGLRGYGKLVIVKHNATYLSAYAHNDKILVKEGDSVAKGQKIAEMGRTDASEVKLHFEIRRLGKPVDPAKYLPLGRS